MVFGVFFSNKSQIYWNVTFQMHTLLAHSLAHSIYIYIFKIAKLSFFGMKNWVLEQQQQTLQKQNRVALKHREATKKKEVKTKQSKRKSNETHKPIWIHTYSVFKRKQFTLPDCILRLVQIKKHANHNRTYGFVLIERASDRTELKPPSSLISSKHRRA